MAAQLGLHSGKIRAPGGFVQALLVLLHPGQQVLDVPKGFIIQVRSHLHGALLAGLHQIDVADGHRSLGTQVVVAAQVDEALVEAVNPAEVVRLAVTCWRIVSDPRHEGQSLVLESDLNENSPAVHLFGLGMAPVLENLDVVEEQANHFVCFVQLSVQFCSVLRRFASVQQTNVLKGGNTFTTVRCVIAQ